MSVFITHLWESKFPAGERWETDGGCGEGSLKVDVPLYNWTTCRRRTGLGGGRLPAMLMAIDGSWRTR